MQAPAGCSVAALQSRIRGVFPPTIVDVRRREAFERDPVRIPLALRLLPEAVDEWAPTLERWRPVVVYCFHGHEVSRDAAAALRAHGLDAQSLEGGLTRWRERGGAVEPWRPPSRWVTRERPKIDRIACPWLIRRFVDASAEILYVPNASVRTVAREENAIPFDVPAVEYTHAGERCSFDAFVARHAPDDDALAALADIVRAADTDTLDRCPQAAGLLAVSLGLGAGLANDAALLHHGLLVYDALYAWCRERDPHTPKGGAVRAAGQCREQPARGPAQRGSTAPASRHSRPTRSAAILVASPRRPRPCGANARGERHGRNGATLRV